MVSIPCHANVTLFQLLTLDNWKQELQKYISPDQLPQVYGGTRCEPDAWCTDYVSVDSMLHQLLYFVFPPRLIQVVMYL